MRYYEHITYINPSPWINKNNNYLFSPYWRQAPESKSLSKWTAPSPGSRHTNGNPVSAINANGSVPAGGKGCTQTSMITAC